MNEIVTGLAIAAGIGLGSLAVARSRNVLDRRAVRKWLAENTRDEPGKSHVGTTELAKGVGLPEDRVRHACITSQKIYRASGDADQWSVWRKEPQSIYEKRGLLSV
ncbi:MAG: hypothetical protein M5U26_08640 [Planctomycetota bacterium]|nr:hypothetical protein [Planctomycetota bacterium]